MTGLKLAALRGDLSLPGPEGWQEVGRVGGLHLYPVKSMAGQAVETFTVCQTGGEAGGVRDRQLMVVDRKGKMVTARRYPHMVLIRPRLTSSQLTLSYPGVEDVSLALPDLRGPAVSVSVWGEECHGVECDQPQVSAWLSAVILGRDSRELRLVCHQQEVESSRPDKPDNPYLYPLQEGRKDRPLYADGYPYLLLSQPSLAGLNAVLQEAGVDLSVGEERFRPNITVTGTFKPFAEDRWVHVKIGDSTVFRNVKLCTRCNYTTIDPATGEKHSEGEPLKTLKTFRSSLDETERKEYGNSPFFGVNLGVEVGGEISVGDKVFISSTIPL